VSTVVEAAVEILARHGVPDWARGFELTDGSHPLQTLHPVASGASSAHRGTSDARASGGEPLGRDGPPDSTGSAMGQGTDDPDGHGDLAAGVGTEHLVAALREHAPATDWLFG
jgi:hypothetical protein